jgi:hypothetical protein
VHKRLGCAHGVDTGEKATHPFQHLKIVQFRMSATALRADAEGKTGVVVQVLTIQHQGADDGDFCLHQFKAEVVFFLDLCIRPALGAVELDDDGTGSCGITRQTML